ncbi:MAG: Rrf2 family transcriptional regulator [Acidobacteria bacterium]|nr:Rrf2 family transcriptional regulator [Acidobacteriota bacterium]
MLSQTVEYALRAIVALAGDETTSWTAQALAAKTQVPASYLSKVLQSLAKANLVVAQRGRNGGFVLAKPASVITVLEVVNAVEPIQRIQKCPLALASHGVRLCSLHRMLDDAYAMVERVFGTATIASILAEPNPARPLCDQAGALHVLHAL